VTDERRELEEGLKGLALSATSLQVEALLRYLDALEETNKSFNLTRIPRKDYVKLHLLDSLAGLSVVPLGAESAIIDIGTGAGFPGVPLATLLPQAHVTLLDSTLKKVRFAAESAKSSGITNVSGLHARAEVIAHDPQFREAFDVVVSRAVAPYPRLVEWMLPLVKPGGVAVALKGSGYEQEMEGCSDLLAALGGGSPQVHAVRLPGTDIERFIIAIPKVGRTGRKLPRA
jgi:16S rRNA (guanine527-N7)-methyltransferase